jgi:hypothetical protein
MIQAVKDGATLTDQELQEEVDTIMLAVSKFILHPAFYIVKTTNMTTCKLLMLEHWVTWNSGGSR